MDEVALLHHRIRGGDERISEPRDEGNSGTRCLLQGADPLADPARGDVHLGQSDCPRWISILLGCTHG